MPAASRTHLLFLHFDLRIFIAAIVPWTILLVPPKTSGAAPVLHRLQDVVTMDTGVRAADRSEDDLHLRVAAVDLHQDGATAAAEVVLLVIAVVLQE